MALIETSKGEIIIVDNALLNELKRYTWYINKIGYVANDSKPRKTMHRFIMGNPRGNVDHKNGNKLDNRKNNLRLCNQSQNTANSNKRTTNKSGFKGVSWNKRYKKWEVYITYNYKHIFGGYFDNIKDAAEKYNKLSVFYFKKFSRKNII